MPVPFDIRGSGIGKRLLQAGIAGIQLFSGNAIMQHQQIPGKQDVLNHRNLLVSVQKLTFPGQAKLLAGIFPQAVFHVPQRNIMRKNRPDYVNQFGHAPPAHKIHAPDQAKGGSHSLRQTFLPGKPENPVLTPQQRKSCLKKGFLRTVGAKKAALDIVAPGVNVPAAAEKFLKQGDILLNIHNRPPFAIIFFCFLACAASFLCKAHRPVGFFFSGLSGLASVQSVETSRVFFSGLKATLLCKAQRPVKAALLLVRFARRMDAKASVRASSADAFAAARLCPLRTLYPISAFLHSLNINTQLFFA